MTVSEDVGRFQQYRIDLDRRLREIRAALGAPRTSFASTSAAREQLLDIQYDVEVLNSWADTTAVTQPINDLLDALNQIKSLEHNLANPPRVNDVSIFNVDSGKLITPSGGGTRTKRVAPAADNDPERLAQRVAAHLSGVVDPFPGKAIVLTSNRRGTEPAIVRSAIRYFEDWSLSLGDDQQRPAYAGPSQLLPQVVVVAASDPTTSDVRRESHHLRVEAGIANEVLNAIGNRSLNLHEASARLTGLLVEPRLPQTRALMSSLDLASQTIAQISGGFPNQRRVPAPALVVNIANGDVAMAHFEQLTEGDDLQATLTQTPLPARIRADGGSPAEQGRHLALALLDYWAQLRTKAVADGVAAEAALLARQPDYVLLTNVSGTDHDRAIDEFARAYQVAIDEGDSGLSFRAATVTSSPLLPSSADARYGEPQAVPPLELTEAELQDAMYYPLQAPATFDWPEPAELPMVEHSIDPATGKPHGMSHVHAGVVDLVSRANAGFDVDAAVRDALRDAAGRGRTLTHLAYATGPRTRFAAVVTDPGTSPTENPTVVLLRDEAQYDPEIAGTSLGDRTIDARERLRQAGVTGPIITVHAHGVEDVDTPLIWAMVGSESGGRPATVVADEVASREIIAALPDDQNVLGYHRSTRIGALASPLAAAALRDPDSGRQRSLPELTAAGDTRHRIGDATLPGAIALLRTDEFGLPSIDDMREAATRCDERESTATATAAAGKDAARSQALSDLDSKHRAELAQLIGRVTDSPPFAAEAEALSSQAEQIVYLRTTGHGAVAGITTPWLNAGSRGPLVGPLVPPFHVAEPNVVVLTPLGNATVQPSDLEAARRVLSKIPTGPHPSEARPSGPHLTRPRLC